jgi:hypothetical protein
MDIKFYGGQKMNEMKWPSVAFDPLLRHLPKYKKLEFEKALVEARAVGKPTEELYGQILAIGKYLISSFLITHPMYHIYIDEMISAVHEVSVDIALRITNDITIQYPIAYIRKAYNAKLFDLPERLRTFGEHRRTRTRRIVDDIPIIQQQLLKDRIKLVFDQTDTELWEVLEKIAETNLELEIMKLRSQGMTEVEVGKQLEIDQPMVARTLKKLFIRYQHYMNNLEGE